MRHCHHIGCVIATLTLLALADSSRADLHILTIGGGYNATGNQVSLEKNVQYFRRVLEHHQLGDTPHHLLFADGNDPARDLQFDDPDTPTPRVHRLLASLLGSTKHQRHSYRSHQLSDVAGPSRVQTIDKWLDETGKKLTPNDRLLIYCTAHGGKTVKKGTQNTKLYLWGNTHITVSDLTKRLDKIDPKVPVAIVMVQCYSGGFANVIFKDGDPKKDIAEHDRCGFYATVHDRVAAGCTPDIAEENYKEYSSAFWAALSGFDRLNHKIEGDADYNHDGRIGFDEAHAYTLITSDTIDISIKTSDAFLRKFSKLKQPKKGDKIDGLLTRDAPFDRVLEMARPVDRAVLEGLSGALDLRGAERVQDAEDLADEIQDERRKVGKKRDKLKRERDGLKKRLASALKERWPEMHNSWHPVVTQLVVEQPDAILNVLENEGSLSRFEELSGEIDALEAERLDLERKWVKTQRFLRVTDNVLLAANLPRVASQDVLDRYSALLAAESATLKP